MERQFTNDDAARYLPYGLGCALELTVAIWLLHGGADRPLSLWLSYFLFAQSGACLLAGFGWYFFWAHERKLTFWYLAGVVSLIGAACVSWNRIFSLGFDGWDLPLAFSLVYAAAGYGLWRLVRFVIVRAFTLLLLAVSEIGAAWRGELRR